jgi:catechol 2,3-dioxygenase
MVCEPLDLDALLSVVSTEPAKEQAPPADLGHVHLRVADLEAAERFYREFLGLAVTQRAPSGSLFFSAGGYHHHIGVELRKGKAAGPVDCAGLVSYRIHVPVEEILYCLGGRAPLLGYQTRKGPQEDESRMIQIRDPNGSWLEVQAIQL